MITLTIKIKYNPAVMNGSLTGLMKHVKDKIIHMAGLAYELTIESDQIYMLLDSCNPHSIAKRVFNHEKISTGMIDCETRKREIVEARQIAMYIAHKRKKQSRKSLQAIGDAIGEKDHTTVLHAVKTINNLIETNKVFRARVEEIEKVV